MTTKIIMKLSCFFSAVSPLRAGVCFAVLLLSASAWAGDLTTDNLTVTKDATINGNMYFFPTAGETNAGVTATGGTITTNGNYRIHTFTNSGTFAVSGGTLNCEVLVVAGGGGGGNAIAGGGGAGGLIYTNSYAATTGSITVTVGGGGAGGLTAAGYGGSSGNNSAFAALTAYGGGGASGWSTVDAQNGGSGGGGSASGGAVSTNGGAATPAGQGNAGGAGGPGGVNYPGGGGGGAGTSGGDGTWTVAGNGGSGLQYSQFAGVGGYPAGWFAGGGGGGVYAYGGTAGNGGTGGGGNGGVENANSPGSPGQANTGGGGGGGTYFSDYGGGGDGGSGIVIVRYPITTSSNITSLSISSNGISQTSVSGSNVFMGKVGIGTNNPAEQLHVVGNVRVDGTNIVSAIKLGNEEPRTTWPTGNLSGSNNLADITDQAAARTNLGLGSAATSDASAFLAPAGNGSQLTGITAAQVGALGTNAGALIAANNLADVADMAAARANLGALSTTGGVVNGGVDFNGLVSFAASFGDVPMGAFTNR